MLLAIAKIILIMVLLAALVTILSVAVIVVRDVIRWIRKERRKR